MRWICLSVLLLAVILFIFYVMCARTIIQVQTYDYVSVRAAE